VIDSFVLNVYSSNESKRFDTVQLPLRGKLISQFHMKNLLREPNGKLGREDIFILIVGLKSVHGTNNDSIFKTINFASSKNQIFKTMMLQCQNVHKYICHGQSSCQQEDSSHQPVGPNFKVEGKKKMTLFTGNLD
jgi:hypothetical protein